MSSPGLVLAYIPSPSQGVVHLGPLPLRGYAFCIVLGILAAVFITERRLRVRGARPGAASEIAYWAVPFGLVGARLYHVITSPDAYFGTNGDPVAALEIWRGGLGIWGAIAGGCLGALIALRRLHIPFTVAVDAAAPGLAVAQAIGRWGNWFNQELYGRPTNLPWALHIDPAHRLPGYENVATYHPTFLYESLWDLGVAGLCLWADRRFRLGKGRVFALYVAAYTVGRAWIEALRIDTAHHFLGLRLNDYVSFGVFLLAVAYLWARRGQRDEPLHQGEPDDDAADVADAESGQSEDSAAEDASPARPDREKARSPSHSSAPPG